MSIGQDSLSPSREDLLAFGNGSKASSEPPSTLCLSSSHCRKWGVSNKPVDHSHLFEVFFVKKGCFFDLSSMANLVKAVTFVFHY